MKELTLEQAVVISGYTGLLACSFDELKEIYKPDFLALCHKQIKETL